VDEVLIIEELKGIILEMVAIDYFLNCLILENLIVIIKF
jgi:hypothetical protein